MFILVSAALLPGLGCHKHPAPSSPVNQVLSFPSCVEGVIALHSIYLATGF
jgi:hypothetical protein